MLPHRLALLFQLAVVVEPLTPPPPRCARFSIRAAGQAFLAPTLAVTLAFSDGTAALAEQPLQEQPSGAAVARIIIADDITSSQLVSALGPTGSTTGHPSRSILASKLSDEDTFIAIALRARHAVPPRLPRSRGLVRRRPIRRASHTSDRSRRIARAAPSQPSALHACRGVPRAQRAVGERLQGS